MSHYSLAQKPAQLSEWAKAICEDIINRKITNPVLVYSGMSGISSATAISLTLHALGYQHGMVYIRKQNEVSHGQSVEWENIGKDRTYIFVDDFLDECKTLNYCHNKMQVFSDYIQFSFLALQKKDYGYNDKLFKPEDSERAHHIKFLNEDSKPVKVRMTANPSNGYTLRSYDSITIDEGLSADWTKSWEIIKQSSSEIIYYNGKWDSGLVKDMPKIVKPKQTIPYWANDWRRK